MRRYAGGEKKQERRSPVGVTAAGLEKKWLSRHIYTYNTEVDTTGLKKSFSKEKKKNCYLGPWTPFFISRDINIYPEERDCHFVV